MTSLNRVLGGIALAVLAVSGRAQAQAQAPGQAPSPPLTPAGNEPAPAPPESCPGEPGASGQACPQPQSQAAENPPPSQGVMAAAPVEEKSWFETAGFALTVGGGVIGFSNSTMRDTTSTGGSWNVRATLGTRQYIALEGLYIGSAQNINALGLSSNSVLLGNGAQADIRLNATTDYVVQPFIYGGAAWRHYSLSNTAFNTSDVASSTNTFELPAGVGIAGKLGGFLLDARGEYRWSWGGDLVPNVNGGTTLNSWGAQADIGYEF